MKPLVLFHGSCADGSGAAYAAYMKFGEEAEYRAVKYGDLPPTDEEVRGREVYVLDFSFKREVHDQLVRAAGSFTLIDHHKTAAETYGTGVIVGWADPLRQAHQYIHIDMNKSGAVLAWEHFHPHIQIPLLLLYIQDRDLWRWKLGSSHEVSAALENRGVREDFKALLKIEGSHLLKMRDRYVEGMARHAEVVEFRFLRSTITEMKLLEAVTRWSEDDTRGAIQLLTCNATVLKDETGNALAKQAAALGMPAMVAVWTRDGAYGIFRVSLRSIGDVDVSGIAKSYGGGGHKNAAGFECKELPWNVVGPVPESKP